MHRETAPVQLFDSLWMVQLTPPMKQDIIGIACHIEFDEITQV